MFKNLMQHSLEVCFNHKSPSDESETRNQEIDENKSI